MRIAVLLISFLHMSFTNHDYESWLEKDPVEYNGNYFFVDFTGYTTDKYLILDIIVSTTEDSLTVTFRKYFNTDSPEDFVKTKIVSPSIKGNVLNASNWKAVFNQELKGEFVHKYPPANAKGPVLKGLLFGTMFFEKVE